MSTVRAGFSIIIVNWNHVEELELCLRSVYREGGDAVEVIVVDNGSVDDSVALMRREFPAVVVVETGTNLGFAEGANRGLAHAHGEWVMTLNNDATILPGSLARARAFVAGVAPDVGMVQPTMVFKSRPHHMNSTGISLIGSGFATDRGFGELEPRGLELNEIFACTAGAGIYRRAMLDAVRLESGVFDRTFFMYFEDVDLGWRCRLAGWRALHQPEIRVAHRFQASSKRHGELWVARLCRRNHVRTLLKNASPALLLAATPWVTRTITRSLLRDRDFEMRFSGAFRDGWRQRSEVEAILKVPRREIELRWMNS